MSVPNFLLRVVAVLSVSMILLLGGEDWNGVMAQVRAPETNLSVMVAVKSDELMPGEENDISIALWAASLNSINLDPDDYPTSLFTTQFTAGGTQLRLSHTFELYAYGLPETCVAGTTQVFVGGDLVTRNYQLCANSNAPSTTTTTTTTTTPTTTTTTTTTTVSVGLVCTTWAPEFYNGGEESGVLTYSRSASAPITKADITEFTVALQSLLARATGIASQDVAFGVGGPVVDGELTFYMLRKNRPGLALTQEQLDAIAGVQVPPYGNGGLNSTKLIRGYSSVATYPSPAAAQSADPNATDPQSVALGVGLGVGITALVVLVVAAMWWHHRATRFDGEPSVVDGGDGGANAQQPSMRTLAALYDGVSANAGAAGAARGVAEAPLQFIPGRTSGRASEGIVMETVAFRPGRMATTSSSAEQVVAMSRGSSVSSFVSGGGSNIARGSSFRGGGVNFDGAGREYSVL